MKPAKNISRRSFLGSVAMGGCAAAMGRAAWGRNPEPPNILWLMGEDLSCDMGCYGAPTHTPNLDKLASEGVRYTNAFTTSGVCSPSRSAMITGMYQTTIGAHLHRSQGDSGKRRGHDSFFPSYHLPSDVRLLPSCFQEAGYFTVNLRAPAPGVRGSGKEDLNFMHPRALFDGDDWSGRKPDQPFFAQINFKLTHRSWQRDEERPIDPAKIELPPYCPDAPAVREDWAGYYESVQMLDKKVGRVLAHLEKQGLLENTFVLFTGDHGADHVRGKYWVYDGGIRVPLIVRWPALVQPDSVSDDLISAIDIAPTLLTVAGIKPPSIMQGQVFLGPRAEKRDTVFAASDRCDETIDTARCVRSKKYKYIRNFTTDKPYLQPNQTKDRQVPARNILRSLSKQNKRQPGQTLLASMQKPTEEFYDIRKDPFEVDNLANSPTHKKEVELFRGILRDWMRNTGDLGLIPEPILEELGREHGSKHAILKDAKNRGLIDRLWDVIELSNKGVKAEAKLIRSIQDDRASVRYWAVTGLGHCEEHSNKAIDALRKTLKDDSACVRVAAMRALGKADLHNEVIASLARHLENENHAVRLYAIHALEELGKNARPALPAIRTASSGKYEYVRRVSNRILRTLKAR
ncbi:MAG: sulfatase-like hydrolase/transferase [Planctomycetes bacterium]|nr:sulfatase-like hydrolase/transferase [Planctomycetota bacterium]